MRTNILQTQGEIKATGFNDQVDKFQPILQENKVRSQMRCHCVELQHLIIYIIPDILYL